MDTYAGIVMIIDAVNHTPPNRYDRRQYYDNPFYISMELYVRMNERPDDTGARCSRAARNNKAGLPLNGTL
jgi:hypothetical protein